MHADDSRGRFFFFLGRRPGLVASFCRRQSVSAACVGEKKTSTSHSLMVTARNAVIAPPLIPPEARPTCESATMATGRTCRALPAFEALPACPELGEAA